MSIAAHPDPAPPRGALSLALPAALALAAAMGIGRFAFTPVWPLMAQEAGLSLAQGSWLASANYAGYLLGALAAAVRPPRHPRAMLAISLLAVAVLTLATPAFHGVLAWSLLRLAAGYGSASAFICVAASRAGAPGAPPPPPGGGPNQHPRGGGRARAPPGRPGGVGPPPGGP
ncbi:YbfB/YjiJ family MFS transporter, partial [Achromobacter ruhlandii]|uniref:YbfB/YjiJ family MFS transporter n=1 Tax=Achromobacter ruhlandii TaxID=72557 RepID=UPI0022B8E728